MSKKKEMKKLKKELAAAKVELTAMKAARERQDRVVESLTKELASASLKAVEAIAEKNEAVATLNLVAGVAEEMACAFDVDNVSIEGKTTTVAWEDGTTTSAICTETDTFNSDIGIMVCFMKRMYGPEYKSLLRMWSTPEKEKILMRVYMDLNNENPYIRKKAQKRWEKIDKNKRQSIRDKVRNLETDECEECEGCDGSCNKCSC